MSLRDCSIRHRLRKSTASAHERVERRLDAIISHPTRESYRWFLMTWHGFLGASEPLILPWLEGCAALQADKRRHLPKLERDLEALGVPEGAAEFGRHPAVPQPGSLAAALGCAYVIEGASLGGQIICSRIGPILGLTCERGMEFLSGYGEETGRMWRSFCVELERHCAGDRSGIEAETFADATFQAFDGWIAERSHKLGYEP